MRDLELDIWELFVKFFREIKGYEDWSEEEIAGSYNVSDVRDFNNYIAKILND